MRFTRPNYQTPFTVLEAARKLELRRAGRVEARPWVNPPFSPRPPPRKRTPRKKYPVHPTDPLASLDKPRRGTGWVVVSD
eukprot:g23338.t1